jgi:hypothetical protein
MAFRSPSSGICDIPGSSASRLFARSTSDSAERCSSRAANRGSRSRPSMVLHWTPGFVWYATLRIGPIPIVRALDMYRTGVGRMLIKAASLITVADAKGKEIDEGEMVRYLSEMMWFPSAFLEDNVSFEAVDAVSARVTLTDRGRTATGTLSFDAAVRLTEFVARRYVGGDLETWSVPITTYGEFEGLKLPVRGKAVWKRADGDQEYIEVTITELHHEY